MVEFILNFKELVNAAKDYCLLIENVELYKSEQWIADAARILPRIQTSMTCFDESDVEYSFFVLPDLECRFELYCRLKDRLGEHDTYWLQYDSHSVLEEMTGSLAGDFSDIYFELKRGLNLLNSGEGNPHDILGLWQAGYVLHWGEHLVNAQSHLLSMSLECHDKVQ